MLIFFFPLMFRAWLRIRPRTVKAGIKSNTGGERQISHPRCFLGAFHRFCTEISPFCTQFPTREHPSGQQGLSTFLTTLGLQPGNEHILNILDKTGLFTAGAGLSTFTLN